MDDFIQFVFILILVISFLSSFFKKKGETKTPPQQKKETRDIYGTNERIRETTPAAKEEYDILKEIESIFKNEKLEYKKKEAEKEYLTRQGVDPEHEVYSKSGGTAEGILRNPASDTEHNATYSEHSVRESIIKQQERFKPKTQKIDKSVDDRAKKFQKMLEEKSLSESSGNSTLKKSIVNRLKNPATLKEFMFISEILGKPKALRR